MPVTTDEQLRSYLDSKKIPYTSVHELAGGTANFVWRINNDHKSNIMKHAEPFVKSKQSISFAVARMEFEAKALQVIPQSLPIDELVNVPELYNYDQDAHMLHISDGGNKTLKEAYADLSLDITAVGTRLGKWLARLHQCTEENYEIGNNVVAKRIYRHSYRNLAKAREQFGFDKEFGEKVDELYGSLIENDDGMICHGDFWPGNVILKPSESNEANQLVPKMTILDWEMCRRGNGVTDVGQFAAEAWLLDRFCGERGLLDAFLKSYAGERKMEKEDCRRVAVHFGTHIGYWPTVVEWANQQETREVVRIGGEVTAKAMNGDWDWLGRSMLEELFKPSKS